MIVIFEGPDRVGKSTQVELLKTQLTKINHLSTHVLHYSYFKNLDKKYQKTFSIQLYRDMFNLIDYNHCNFILDRSHIGEMVYAPLYRHYSGDYVLDLELEYKYLIRKVNLITLINSDINILKDKNDNNSLSNNDLIKIKDETQSFINATNKSNIYNKIIIDVNNLDVDAVYYKILEFLFNRETMKC
ncbi:MAG TPA: hypothetical protein PLY35_08310 [Thermotogota bacterium]|nr:hypothetical protein [Thermotogota bacterium]